MRTVSSRKAALDSVTGASHPTTLSRTRKEECASPRSLCRLATRIQQFLVSATECPSSPHWRRQSSASDRSLAVWASRRGFTLPAEADILVKAAAERFDMPHELRKHLPVCGGLARRQQFLDHCAC